MESEILKWAAGGGSLGGVIVFGLLLIRLWDAWVRGRTKIAQSDLEVETGTNTEWMKLAKFLQRRIGNLEKRVEQDEHDADAMRKKCDQEIDDLRKKENETRRLYEAVRRRCDSYEEAMKQANIPFKAFDSDDFKEGP